MRYAAISAFSINGFFSTPMKKALRGNPETIELGEIQPRQTTDAYT
jgi:hypothetical protein